MDEINSVITKLIALSDKVVHHLNRGDRYFDPPIALDYFQRFEKMKDFLKKKFPDLFSDIPDREIPKSSGTTDFEERGYINREPVHILFTDMREMIDIWNISQSSKTNLPSIKVTREGVFFSGQYFDALYRVKEILATAKRSIIIIDGYANEDVLNLVSDKSQSVEVKILTSDVKPPLITAANAFNKQYGKLSIKKSSVFHDRFVIIDEANYYHFGASIKDLGNRGFMFSLIEESFVINALQQQFDNEWAKATIKI